MNDWISTVALVAALGSGVIAGVFFAFSTFVMQALARLTPARGIEAMQWINRTVVNAWFLGAFFGTAVLGAFLAALALRQWDNPASRYLLAGGLLYVVGTFLATVVFNVPLNERLAKVEASSEEGSALWAHYLKRWTAWNTVRTIAALLAAAAFTLGIG